MPNNTRGDVHSHPPSENLGERDSIGHYLGMMRKMGFFIFLLAAVFVPLDVLLFLAVAGVVGFVCIKGVRRFLEAWLAL